MTMTVDEILPTFAYYRAPLSMLESRIHYFI